MKTKTRNFLIGTALAAAVGATGVAVADRGGYGGGCPQGAQIQPGQGGHGPGMMQGHGMMDHVMDSMQGMLGMMGDMGTGLGLNDEQKAELVKLRQQFLPQMSELRSEMQANHEQWRALNQKDALDEAAIAELADRKGALMAEMIKLHAAQRARMQALLTDEQREQMRQRHRGMGMGHGMMGTPPADG